MKVKNFISVIVGFAVYFALHAVVTAYRNVDTHPKINEEIVNKTIEKISQEDYPRLRLSLDQEQFTGLAVTNPGYEDWGTEETSVGKTPREWIIHGGYSADEPEAVAAIRHFYDPVALSGVKYLTNRRSTWEGWKSNPQIDAIEWALGDTPKGKDNKWNASEGKQAFGKAFENIADANSVMAKVWRILGEILHNTADMGIPCHVRNDSHASPIGWNLGFMFGSPDPYEELFRNVWVSKYRNFEIDKNFENSLKSAKSIRDVNDMLARFTNSNFFSHETINGQYVAPVNSDGLYSSPKLEDLNYHSDNFTYYKTFASGNVMMCKDYSYMSRKNRGYPYIDKECAESQASVLIPYIIASAKRVIELYFPEVNIEMEVKDNYVEGKINHKTNEEYPDELLYNGKVEIKYKGKVYQVESSNGKFSFSPQENVQAGEALQAKIDCGGVVYEKVMSSCTLCDNFFWALTHEFKMIMKTKDTFKLYHAVNNWRQSSIDWNNNTFKAFWDTSSNNERISTNIDAQFTKDGNKLLKLSWNYNSRYEYKKEDFDMFEEVDFEMVFEPADSFVEAKEQAFGNDMMMKVFQYYNSNFFKNVKYMYVKVYATTPVYENGKMVGVKTEEKYFESFDQSFSSYFAILLGRKKE